MLHVCTLHPIFHFFLILLIFTQQNIDVLNQNLQNKDKTPQTFSIKQKLHKKSLMFLIKINRLKIKLCNTILLNMLDIKGYISRVKAEAS